MGVSGKNNYWHEWLKLRHNMNAMTLAYEPDDVTDVEQFWTDIHTILRNSRCDHKPGQLALAFLNAYTHTGSRLRQNINKDITFTDLQTDEIRFHLLQMFLRGPFPVNFYSSFNPTDEKEKESNPRSKKKMRSDVLGYGGNTAINHTINALRIYLDSEPGDMDLEQITKVEDPRHLGFDVRNVMGPHAAIGFNKKTKQHE